MANRKNKLIASFEYQNGRFGTNRASLSRCFPSTWLPGGWLFSNGFADPMFYTSPIEAKNAYRLFREHRRERAAA